MPYKNPKKYKDYQKKYQKTYDRKKSPGYDPVKAKRAMIKRRYDLTWDQFMLMWESQQKQCAICSRFLDLAEPRLVHIDHNHTTGKVRALLCRPCNTVLGHVEPRPEVLAKMQEYLQQWQ